MSPKAKRSAENTGKKHLMRRAIGIKATHTQLVHKHVIVIKFAYLFPVGEILFPI